MMVWEKLLPMFDFSFRDFSFRAVQTVQTVSLHPHPPCIRCAVPSYPCLLFFSFFPFHPNLSAAMSSSSSPPPRLTLTQAISCQRHLNTATTAPTPWPLQLPPCHPLQGAEHPLDSLSHMCHRHTQATLPLSPSLCLVHLKKASDKSFPFFSPLSLMMKDTSPQHRPIAPPCGMQAPTPPPLMCMQVTLLPLLSPPPPPPQCLYDCHHFPDPVILQLVSPDFATWTGGAKGVLAPTISTRPHLLTLPLCVGHSTCVAAPVAPLSLCALPHPAPPCVMILDMVSFLFAYLL